MLKLKLQTMLVALFLCLNAFAFAEQLSFKVGDKASYTILQNLNIDMEGFGDKINFNSLGVIGLDIEILSANPETQSYPFEVEIIVQNLQFLDRIGSAPIHVEEKINHLIGIPLRFVIEKDLQVKEMTNYLAVLSEDQNEIKDYAVICSGVLGTKPELFKLFLTQLFQLSSTNVELSQSYPVTYFELLKGENSHQKDVSIDQSSSYEINQIDEKQVKGTLKGNAKILNNGDMTTDLSVNGNVVWDLSNSLIQTTNLQIVVEEIRKGDFESRTKMSVYQKWIPNS